MAIHNCNFAIVMNRNVNISICSYKGACNPQVERTTALRSSSIASVLQPGFPDLPATVPWYLQSSTHLSFPPSVHLSIIPASVQGVLPKSQDLC